MRPSQMAVFGAGPWQNNYTGKRINQRRKRAHLDTPHPSKPRDRLGRNPHYGDRPTRCKDCGLSQERLAIVIPLPCQRKDLPST
ncbi:hypothetical protein CDAR_277351 [Caerostris darwini]|uniref:Uncharacterized protein n=1 Tax=Caerostris darwini TaxID=1538125 RepID=A0AAV4VT16_9ARAC|nr:hypothetical protein CDAR_277351 [Caerostris darwini]